MVRLNYRTGMTTSGFFTFSQAFDAGKMGVDRIGGYAMVGGAPTTWATQTGPSGATILPGSGVGNKSFSREGFYGLFYFGEHADVTVVTQHGEDNAWFGQGYGDFLDGIAGVNNVTGSTLAAGSKNPTWNGVLIEPHYVYSPQLIFIGRYETIRMSQQAEGVFAGNPSNFGNITTYTVAMRYNPFMTSRAGFAFHNEYNWWHQDGTGPTLGLNTVNLNVSEFLTGFDFDF